MMAKSCWLLAATVTESPSFLPPCFSPRPLPQAVLAILSVGRFVSSDTHLADARAATWGLSRGDTARAHLQSRTPHADGLGLELRPVMMMNSGAGTETWAGSRGAGRRGAARSRERRHPDSPLPPRPPRRARAAPHWRSCLHPKPRIKDGLSAGLFCSCSWSVPRLTALSPTEPRLASLFPASVGS